jgi:hypothetical protein
MDDRTFLQMPPSSSFFFEGLFSFLPFLIRPLFFSLAPPLKVFGLSVLVSLLSSNPSFS